MTSAIPTAGDRLIRSLAIVVFIGTFILTGGCGKSTKESSSHAGVWEGYIGWGTTVPHLIKGDLTINIDSSEECDIEGYMSGNLDTWGDFEITFTGSLPVRTQGDLYGEITAVRRRAGVDTLGATVLFTGEFSETSPYAFGQWRTMTGSAFGSAGLWTVKKN